MIDRCTFACCALMLSWGIATAGEARIRGLLVPMDHATIASRLDATISSIGPDNGEPFDAGDVLVTFDCGRYDAELERARAAADAAGDTLEVKRQLAGSGSASRLQAVLAEADLKRARAEVTVATSQTAQCLIRAPYAGRVVRRIANANETVGFGAALIEIAGSAGLEVRMFVPSSWLAWLAVGDRVSFDVEETGSTVEARIVATGAWIDNVSKLAEVRATVTSPAKGLVAGMSGTVRLEPQSNLAAGTVR